MTLTPFIVRTTHQASSRDEFFAREIEAIGACLGSSVPAEEVRESYTVSSLTDLEGMLSQPTLSSPRIVFVTLSPSASQGDEGDASTGPEESATKKSTKKKKTSPTSSLSWSLPADTYIRIGSIGPLSEEDERLIRDLGGVIEVDQEPSRSETISTLRSLLPGVSAEVVRLIETYPLEDIIPMAEYFHLGYADDASHLGVSLVQSVFPQDSHTRSYELLDKLLSRDMASAARIYDDLTSEGSLWSLIPTLRTQLRRYLAALHMRESRIPLTEIESIIGVKVFVIDRLTRSKMTARDIARFLSGVHEIHRDLITGQFGGKSESYVLVRLISLFSQG